jgi:beta-glucosidase
VAWLSHFLGIHAPGLRDIRAAARAMHHVLLAHGTAIQAMRAMRAMGQPNLGAVCNLEWADPVDPSPETSLATARYDAIYNRWFLGGIFNKEYPKLALEGLEPHMPKDWQADMDIIGTPVDWCGLNYYTRKLVAPAPGPWPNTGEAEGPLPKTQMGWEIYPEGLEKFLLRTEAEYSRGLPIYITENGMASPEIPVTDGEVDDPERTDYVARHLAAVQRAIAKGANVQGYFCWSLLDNYEWSLGYEKRFGLVHVDFESLQRTPKSSYHALTRALARNTPGLKD